MGNWPILMTFTYPQEAHVVKGYLASNGIETIIHDELTTQVINFYSNAIGGVKLLVSESDYNQGIQLLKDGGYLVDEDSETEDKFEIVLADQNTNKKICPFCSSENIAVNHKPGVIFYVLCVIMNLLIMLGAISLLFKSSFKCYDCGKEWKYKKK